MTGPGGPPPGTTRMARPFRGTALRIGFVRMGFVLMGFVLMGFVLMGSAGPGRAQQVDDGD